MRYESQAELVAVLNRRLAERGRESVAATVAQTRREYDAWQCRSNPPTNRSRWCVRCAWRIHFAVVLLSRTLEPLRSVPADEY